MLDGDNFNGAGSGMSVTDFYDALAPSYHLIFDDWDASIGRQAEALDAVVRSLLGTVRGSVLDVACGIGTQCLGLAALGYAVTASDLAPAAVARARSEAAKRDLTIDFSVADLRRAHGHHGREFDVVLCADNSLPHLLSDAEIGAALGELLRCTRPGGLCIVSVRDYAALERGGTQMKPYGAREDGGVRYVLFQVWKWREPLYDTSFYIVRDAGAGDCHTRVARTTYYAISVADVARLMEGAGFVKVRRIDGRLHQPLIVGVRPA